MKLKADLEKKICFYLNQGLFSRFVNGALRARVCACVFVLLLIYSNIGGLQYDPSNYAVLKMY